jgi:hypothetical protein
MKVDQDNTFSVFFVTFWFFGMKQSSMFSSAKFVSGGESVWVVIIMKSYIICFISLSDSIRVPGIVE